MGMLLVVWAGHFGSVAKADELLVEVFGFESDAWETRVPDNVHRDSTVVHGGSSSLRLEHDSHSQGYTAAHTIVDVQFSGGQLVLTGWFKAHRVGQAGFYIKQLDGTPNGSLSTTVNAEVRGWGGGWRQYRIETALHPEARRLELGIQLNDDGHLWVDDFALSIDGVPVHEAERVSPRTSVLERDREFDSGSGISGDSLTPIQVENLVLLAKVWGFLKYHHPAVTGGQVHWDYELFRLIHGTLRATNSRQFWTLMVDAIDALGPLEPCDPCAQLPSDIHLPPNHSWIFDSERLGEELSSALAQVYIHRHAEGLQYYVDLTADVGSPVFLHEQSYTNLQKLDAGYRLLGAFRYWNIVAYWAPSRDLAADWDTVLQEAIPRFWDAANREEYQVALIRLIGELRDSHALLKGPVSVYPPEGDCVLPVRFGFVEDEQLVVTSMPVLRSDQNAPLQMGDVVTHIDGIAVSELIARWTPYYSASNRAVVLRRIAGVLSWGRCGAVSIQGESAQGRFEVVMNRRPHEPKEGPEAEPIQWLREGVLYVNLTTIQMSDVERLLRELKRAESLVVDQRGYPSLSLVHVLGPHLVPKRHVFAVNAIGDLANPSAVHWHKELALHPKRPFFDGKVAILVNSSTQSSAEFHAMAFRQAPHSAVIGSQTAGADGSVSRVPLPGGFHTHITGVGIFTPERASTQGTGIEVDIEVIPTVGGIQSGIDEVLEAALQWLEVG